MTAREESRLGKQFTTEECERLFGEACRRQRDVLTQTQVREDPELPCFDTLQNRLGPWYFWDEKFNVPFRDKQRRERAEVMKDKARKEEAERAAARKRFEEKVAAGLATPTVFAS